VQIQDDKAKLLYELDNMQEQLEKANMLVNRYYSFGDINISVESFCLRH
jgi:hypothetical protein